MFLKDQRQQLEGYVCEVTVGVDPDRPWLPLMMPEYTPFEGNVFTLHQLRLHMFRNTSLSITSNGRNLIECIQQLPVRDGGTRVPNFHYRRRGPPCVVCDDAEAFVMFVACRHVVCCDVCSTRVSVCPFCRTVIGPTDRVILPRDGRRPDRVARPYPSVAGLRRLPYHPAWVLTFRDLDVPVNANLLPGVVERMRINLQSHGFGPEQVRETVVAFVADVVVAARIQHDDDLVRANVPPLPRLDADTEKDSATAFRLRFQHVWAPLYTDTDDQHRALFRARLVAIWQRRPQSQNLLSLVKDVVRERFAEYETTYDCLPRADIRAMMTVRPSVPFVVERFLQNTVQSDRRRQAALYVVSNWLAEVLPPPPTFDEEHRDFMRQHVQGWLGGPGQPLNDAQFVAMVRMKVNADENRFLFDFVDIQPQRYQLLLDVYRRTETEWREFLE